MTDVRGSLVSHRLEMDVLSGAPTTPAVCTDRLKRVGDVAIASLLLVFAFPLLLVVSIFIALGSRGAIVTVHKRSGLNGLPINVLKFRTRRTGADQADGSAEMTTVGRFLETTGVDALPQLLSVLKGDMSMVGPTPHSATIDRYYGSIIPQYGARMRAKPGFTGLAQVNGPTDAKCSIQGMVERITDDNAYIDYWSATLDLRILMRAAIRTVYRPDGF